MVVLTGTETRKEKKELSVEPVRIERALDYQAGFIINECVRLITPKDPDYPFQDLDNISYVFSSRFSREDCLKSIQDPRIEQGWKRQSETVLELALGDLRYQLSYDVRLQRKIFVIE